MQSTSIWITGANGRLGSALMKSLRNERNYKVIGTDRDVDITNYADVESAMDIYKPQIVINCASISDADFCEQNEVEAYRVNALGARNLAVATRQHNAKLIHISTDDVFSGINNRAKNEFDIPTPETIYGKSKYAGETFVTSLNPKHLVIRSSWVYGRGGADYVDYVLAKAKAGESFAASVDHISTPTRTRSLVNFIKSLLPSNEYGIFHASCEGVCTRHQFATTILSYMGYDPTLAVASFSDQGAVVSTVLDNLMMKVTGIYEMPDWQKDLKEFLDKVKEEK